MPAISFKIPYDSNLRYLPLVYLLPEELWYRSRRTLVQMPHADEDPPQSASGVSLGRAPELDRQRCVS